MKTLESMDLSLILNRKPYVLVVDDDKLNRDLLQAYLNQAGCEVGLASDGQSGHDMIHARPPDLALVDIHMPRMDGLSLCRSIKLNPATRLLPVIIVTAYDTDKQKIAALDAGADDFISKPYSAIILLTRVRSLLRLKKLNDDIATRNRLLQNVLERFVDEDVAEILLTNPEQHLKLGGETRDVTVLFLDIRGFSAYTEKHAAEEVIQTLNEIFRPLSQIISDHHGTFDKYLGDGLMAFFGAPLPNMDAAGNALQAARAMLQEFTQLSAHQGGDFLELGLGVGIHSGPAVVGLIGSEQMMDYTVVGDTVNVAKRLQEQARAGQIILSKNTCERIHVPDAVCLDALNLPGRQEPITCYLVEQPFTDTRQM